MKENKSITSFNTAISRSRPSAPLIKVLKSYFKFDNDYDNISEYPFYSNSFLDYGCGRGFDSNFISRLGIDIDSYDPHWKPFSFGSKRYDYIFCTYVLNVIQKAEEDYVLEHIRSLLAKNGVAFISVRRDITKDGETSRGFQRNVVLNMEKLCDYKGNYCTYILRGNDEF